MEVYNRKARYDYAIEEEYEAGIVLTGTEVKSIRAGKCSIEDSYGLIRKGEAYLVNMFINLYKEETSLIMKKKEVESFYFIKKRFKE